MVHLPGLSRLHYQTTLASQTGSGEEEVDLEIGDHGDLMRCWWTAPEASRAGMAVLSGPILRSERTRN